MYENDFIKEEAVEFDIEGRKFLYQPVTGGQENEWLNEYMSMDDKGKLQQDFSKLNKCKSRNIKAVPYDKETIKNIIGIEKDWCDLNENQRWSLLSKLNPQTFDEIFKKIKNIDTPNNVKKKDS